MVAGIRLQGRAGGLTIEPRNPQWCEVTLTSGGSVRVLGAAPPADVLAGLRRALAGKLDRSAAGVIEGVAVTGAFALAEEHTTVYVGDSGATRIMFFEGRDGRVFARLALEPHERAEWLSAIASARLGGA